MGSLDEGQRGRTADILLKRSVILGEKIDSEAVTDKSVIRSIVGLVDDLCLADLEEVTAGEIRRHRKLRDAAARLFDVWQSDPAPEPDLERTCEAHKEYLVAMIALQAQQTVVSTLLEVLGYIPNVPPDTGH